MTGAAYATRYRAFRDALDRLDPATLGGAVGTAMLDQLQAATQETLTWHERVSATLTATQPDRYGGRFEVADQALITDTTARILAAMGDGRWSFCPHLRRTPAQPAYVQLPLRSVVCQRCAGTVRKPPADEGDRCDLCGTRGHVTFWPVCFALSNWLVLGDMCGDCAHAVLPAAGVTP